MAKLPRDMEPARVVGQHRRQWDLATEGGIVRAMLAGRLWADEKVTQVDDAQPTVGDWVAMLQGADNSSPVITHVLERKTRLSRTSMARRGLRQTLVANIDQVAVVAAFAKHGATDHVALRSLHPRRIERYVAAVRQGGATPLVVLNKADLVDNPEEQARALEHRLGNCEVVPISTKSSEGLAPLSHRLLPRTTIGLVGLSGVGKSSIVNQLFGKQVQQVEQERKADSRGRHTTTHRQLFQLPSGVLVIDTPGMREFALAELDAGEKVTFEDIATFARACQFRDCEHRSEPGCAVQKAVEQGQLDADRLRNYLTLEKEQSEQAAPRRRKPLTRRKRSSARGHRRQTEDD